MASLAKLQAGFLVSDGIGLSLCYARDQARRLDAVGGGRSIKALQARHPAGGAEDVSHAVWFSSPTLVMDAPSAADVAAKLGIGKDEKVVAFCNTGHWAATEWFALSELAGVENAKLYPDSKVGRSQSGGEMENAPNLLRNLLGASDTRRWVVSVGAEIPDRMSAVTAPS